MKILVYGFGREVVQVGRLVSELEGEGITKFYLGRTALLLKEIEIGNYDFVLGLGNFRWRRKNLMIVKRFVNKYRRKMIVKEGKEFLSASWDLPVLGRTIFSDVVTFGPCNRSGYLIESLIEEKNLKTKFAFVHVPTCLEMEKTKVIVEEWLRLL